MGTLAQQAQALMHDERWDEAIELLLRNAPVVVVDPELSWNLGWAYFKLGDFDAAVASLRAAATVSAGWSSYHWALAFALLESGDTETAEIEFKAALALGDHLLAWTGLALLYQRSGNLEAAELTHQAAMERRPESRDRVEAYADFLSDVGRDGEAREQYQRSALLWPESRREVQ